MPLIGLNNKPVSFKLVVITTPAFFAGEAACLEGMLEAGLEKLHLRKPGAADDALEGLLRQLSSSWYSRLVLHGSRDLAVRYGIPHIHCPVKSWQDGGRVTGDRLLVSVSLHSWEELRRLEKDYANDIAYVLMSPLFDSISKPGYMAVEGLLRGLPAADSRKIKVIGLGGIGPDTILPVIEQGFDGAAVLGWIWEEPALAVKRFIQLKNIIEAS